MCCAAAFTCYQTALQLRPNFPQGLNNLAVIFTAQGRAQDALQMLQAAIAAAPDYAEAYNNLGVLQREVGAIKVCMGSFGRVVHPTSLPRDCSSLIYMPPNKLKCICGSCLPLSTAKTLQLLLSSPACITDILPDATS